MWVCSIFDMNWERFLLDKGIILILGEHIDLECGHTVVNQKQGERMECNGMKFNDRQTYLTAVVAKEEEKKYSL